MNYFDKNPKIECINKDHVSKWTLARLRPRSSLEVREMMHNSNEEIETTSKGEWIANNLRPGDNVTIPTIDGPFWLMLIEKGPHIVPKSFKDVDANEWTKGDMVI